MTTHVAYFWYYNMVPAKRSKTAICAHRAAGRETTERGAKRSRPGRLRQETGPLPIIMICTRPSASKNSISRLSPFVFGRFLAKTFCEYFIPHSVVAKMLCTTRPLRTEETDFRERPTLHASTPKTDRKYRISLITLDCWK